MSDPERIAAIRQDAETWLACARGQTQGWANLPSIPIGLVQSLLDRLAAVERERDAANTWIPKCKHCHRAITRIDLPAPEGPYMKGEHGWIHVSPTGVFCPHNEQGEIQLSTIEPEDSIICRMWETLDAQRAKAEATIDQLREHITGLEAEKVSR